jgi:hypothetical protein
MGSVTDIDIFKAALDHVRQLSTLRFAILTVFMTATGALFSAYFLSLPDNHSVHYPLAGVALAGLWLSITFAVFEINLSFTMACQHNVARTKANDPSSFPHRRKLALWSVRLLTLSIYVAVASCWVVLLLRALCK